MFVQAKIGKEGNALSVSTTNPTKVAEPIVMSFWLLNSVGPRNYVLDGREREF